MNNSDTDGYQHAQCTVQLAGMGNVLVVTGHSVTQAVIKTLHRVSNIRVIFLNNFVKHWLILIDVGTLHQEKKLLQHLVKCRRRSFVV